MKKIGLTGNIGSGKSTIAAIFKVLTVPVFSADQAGRMVLGQSQSRNEIEKVFGSSVIDNEGQVIRQKLGEVVFNDDKALAKLNAIVHPRVKDMWEDWLQMQSESSYVVHEAAILFESGFNRYMDEVIVVSAPEPLRFSRVADRDGVELSVVRKRAEKQWPERELLKHADHIIDNGGGKALIPQVLEIHNTLMWD